MIDGGNETSGAETGAEDAAADADDEEGLAEAAADPSTGEASDEPAPPEGSGGEGDDPTAVDYVELAKIHNVRDRNEARIIKGILESFNIPCVAEDDTGDMVSMPTELDGIDILVPAQFAQKARDVLCERNIVCGIEPGRLEALLGEVNEKLASDAEGLKAIAGKVGEETRDYRHEALTKIGKRGEDGFKLLRALLVAALHTDDENPVAHDVAYLTDLGTFGKERALLILADLDQQAKDPDAAVRKRVARSLGRLHGVGAAPALVDFLLDDDAGARDEALEGLYALSNGETFDFDPDLTPASQEEAILKWRGWLLENPGA